MAQRFSTADLAATEFRDCRLLIEAACGDGLISQSEMAEIRDAFERTEPLIESAALGVRRAVRELRTGALNRNDLAQLRDFERQYPRYAGLRAACRTDERFHAGAAGPRVGVGQGAHVQNETTLSVVKSAQGSRPHPGGLRSGVLISIACREVDCKHRPYLRRRLVCRGRAESEAETGIEGVCRDGQLE